MLLINADLHIHSRFSGATSEKMTLRVLAKEAAKKGVSLLGTGDCLHPIWLKEIKELLTKIDDGTFELDKTRFVLTAEVEDSNRVHHLLIFPSLSAVEWFIELIRTKAQNLASDGRPNVYLTGEQLAEYAKKLDVIIGASHAFTPWTAIYAYHDSLKSCYGDLTDYVSFVELGLSADTNYADRIKELAYKTFLTNSDAHSPYPLRLAREFNRFQVEAVTFEELKGSILRVRGRKPVLNVGIPPEEGKYNETACIKCYQHYKRQEAIALNWYCNSCTGRIKKGVKDRIEELADYKEPMHPEHRPPYLHLIPLSEIIAKALHLDSPLTKKVFEVWNELVKEFKTEVNVLVDVNIEELRKRTDERVAHAIQIFREGNIIIQPGGGGKYGVIKLPEELPLEDKEAAAPEHAVKEQIQKKIFDF